MAKKKTATKKKKAGKKTSKKNPKAKRPKRKRPKRPKRSAKPKEKKVELITLLHRRMRRTGKERGGFRIFRGFIQVPENKTRSLRFLKRRGYEEVPASELKAARDEANKRAAYLVKNQKISSLAEARRMEMNRKHPGRLITERDRIAQRARETNANFNSELRKLTNTLQKATAKAIDDRKLSGDTQFTKKNAAAVSKAQGAIDKLRGKNNPAVRGQKATQQQEARINAEQAQVDKVRSAEGVKAEKDAVIKKRALAAKAKKEAIDKAKTAKVEADAAKEEAKTGPTARGEKATNDLTARREADEARAERRREAQAKADAKAKKAAEKKTSKDA